MAFGKRNKVSNDIGSYTVGLIGESGIGKTTTLSKICEKVFGSDGYILLNVGKEYGVSAIADITYEDVPDYKTWNEITKDIIKNKNTDYPNLKVLVADTLDQLFSEVLEPESIRLYNTENVGKKDFSPAKTINAAWGGFGRGEEYAIKLLLDRIDALRKVGVLFWFTGHTKTREVVDPLSGTTFTSLTTNMMQKYFNAVKTKTDVLGVACIDRDVIKEGLGRKDIVTHKEVTRNKIVSESRRIKFRDESYCVDSKSRFPEIAPEISLDADEFIKALQDAIDAEAKKNGSTATTTVKKPDEQPIVESIDEYEDITAEPDEVTDEPVKEEVDKDALMAEIRAKFSKADKETKAKVKQLLKDSGVAKLDDSLSISELNTINTILG